MNSLYMIMFVALAGIVSKTSGHGRLWEPPSRSSMWRRGYNTSININDNELSCGGFTNQWILNRGRCGVCGDPYQQQHPRDNENGGIYASGLITRTYPVGAIMEVVVDLTANHGGYFEFKLCPVYDSSVPSSESQECMDKHRLAILGADADGFKYHIRDHLLVGEVRLSVILPTGLYCKHCVLQWKYRTGTRWGCDGADLCGHGLGPQEEFYGCSDIAISDVPNTVHLVPKQAENQDKVGLNDLGSKHHRTQGTGFGKMASSKPVIKFVAHKSASYNSTATNNVEETPTTHSTNNVRADAFMLFMENLLMNSIKNYYNRNTDGVLGIVGVTACEAVSQYQNNPIINEWCRKTCPKEPGLCPSTICKCAKIPPKHRSTMRQEGQNQYTDDREKLRLFAKELISQSKKHNVTKGKGHPSTIGHSIVTLPVFKNFIGSQIVNHLRSHLVNEKIDPGSSDPNTGVKLGGTSKLEHPHLGRKYGETSQKPHHDTLEIQSDPNAPRTDTAPPVETSKFRCTASTKFAHNEFMANWCLKNCSFGFCPRMVCTCSS